jgi:hypothetical protein
MTKAKTTVTQLFFSAIVLGTMAARGALAAERGLTNVPGGAGFQSNHIGGFDRPAFDRAPAPLPPVFNQSNPYTAPQSPERPVSPASPGSVFGAH